MSAPSTRRLKDRNGIAGPKIAAVQKPKKIITPISNSTPNPCSALKKSTSGVENPGLNSRTQKPTIRSVPRVDKVAASAAVVVPRSDGSESRMRWSTSSVPRGRSSSPSDFIRVFRDSRVCKGESDNREVSSAEKKNRTRNSVDSKENGRFSVGVERNEKSLSRMKVSGGNFNNVMQLRKVSDVGNVGVKFDKLSVDSSGSDCKVGCSNELSEKRSKIKVLENLKDKGLFEDSIGSKVGVKYPSKIYEKVAFLEGKVKRIASDIKRTKEMLDMNNPDASKKTLSAIQDKLSGIEKVIRNVGGDSSKKIVNEVGGDSLRISVNEVGEKETVVRSKNERVDQVKGSVKGLNSEELEARLFPHHKLLRNRILLKETLGSSQLHIESTSEPKIKEMMLSPVEENTIALEFLASLNKQDTKVTLRDTVVGFESSEVKETENAESSSKPDSSNVPHRKSEEEPFLTSEETLDEFDDQENKQVHVTAEETEDTCVFQVNEIGTKSSTGGWFVSEGESVLLAHDDGSCSFYDIANCEEKAVYKPPEGVSPNIWRDCWIVRAPSADGCSGRYVVAASAGSTLDSGFCSWDFYTKDVQAFHMEDAEAPISRTVLGPIPNSAMYRRNISSTSVLPETRQWWYRPCGPLIVATASSQRVVKIFDVRDGEQIMKWEVQKPVLAMDNSSPLQWRNRGKVVIAETEAISVWDVNSLNQQSLLSISSSGRKISALHVNNTDAELGGGVRQRVSSSEAEGNDGVFCTSDSINILDFRHPSGIGLKIPKVGGNVQSVFTRGDSVYIGCTNAKSEGKKELYSQVQKFSLRKQGVVSYYTMPESNAHPHHSAITQVWGNSDSVMGVCGLGLFVFDAVKDDEAQSSAAGDSCCTQNVKDVIGPNDLYSPSFDYMSSRVLIISRDRPALWSYLK
ncbi:KIN14B-interacting protein At4g14310 [Mercurialis annua]|uniref:KIN14B-interacting protein At4g14310 n=1 Tax=Mercurialis annua TaxID=3986 RepID=UPI00215F9795|nr:KIN14B-interacting protein At4g14310 [Mercurialis annua]